MLSIYSLIHSSSTYSILVEIYQKNMNFGESHFLINDYLF